MGYTNYVVMHNKTRDTLTVVNINSFDYWTMEKAGDYEVAMQGSRRECEEYIEDISAENYERQTA
jgi:hypothetical protein